MKILHVLPDAEIGGGHVNALRLDRALTALTDGGCAARFLLPGDAEDTLRRSFAEAETIYGAHRGRSGLLTLARDILSAARGADIVHAHGLRAALAARAARIMARAALRPRFGLLYNIRGTHVANWRNQALASALQRTAISGADAVVLVSDRDAAINRDLYGLARHPCARVVRNGVAPPDTPLPDDRERSIDLLFVGRFVPQKNPEDFVRTVAEIARGGRKPPRCVMVGGGELEAPCRALIAELGLRGIEIRPSMGNAELAALMRRSRILAMTSRWEGLPTVAIEAALNGAAPCGYDVFAETLPDGLRPDLTPPEPTPEALARTIGALLDDPAKRRGAAVHAHTHARTLFSPRRMAEGYLETYRRIQP